MLVNQGEYPEAQTLFTAALAAYQKTLGENHEYVTIVLRHLIKLHQTTGNVAGKQSALEHLLRETLINSDRQACAVNRQHLRCFISAVARLQPTIRALNLTISTRSLTRPN
ncbi:MAG: tetratricopeptide repeat protein [Planctomycetes bacterium]|nr:tetratricopeptide repeat protein [Planctomycetota bacterium]